MLWTQAKDLQKQIQRLWDRGIILNSLLCDKPVFPIRLLLKTPTSKELSENFDQVRQWISSLQDIKSLRLEMKTIQHRILGENQVPAAIWLDSLDDAIKILRVKNDVQTFSELIALTKKNHPALIDWIKNHCIKTWQLAEAWPKLLDVIDWIKRNPNSGIYLRQVDIPGIDSKFIEHHRKILTTLLDLSLPDSAIKQHATGARHFAQRYGFQGKPTRVRFRILDPDIQLIPGNCQDLTVSHAAFSQLDENPQIKTQLKTLIITENEINFLVFPEMQHSMVIFGAGYGFEFLSNVSWLSQLNIYYWGDIDTHGFAILDQLRAKLPHTTSILMDEKTLLDHRSFWELEHKPSIRELTKLSPKENQLYHNLINNTFADKLRLEQERIGYAYVLAALTEKIGCTL
ncbi:MAG: DUF2220 family protein [Gammaproteobacteria bacterium]|nr:DUF2220 family protein [Gammaproteobacteria bacterium]